MSVRVQREIYVTSGSGRKGAVEAIRDFIPQPPGCRQVTSLAPMAAWRLLPSSKKVWPLGPEDFWIDDAISESRQGLVGSNAAEAGQRRGYEASRAQQSDRPPIAKRAIRERYGQR
jgi:hypothetical protein